MDLGKGSCDLSDVAFGAIKLRDHLLVTFGQLVLSC